ncbi:ornithine cyclodeaminase [Bacillus sp. L_1B0_8]|uniref:2,3-diaminopropionate biosynthesis protein SbnB n=1 Tax=unclassified Bacillus (in: firmicutes) TaxID=185979 RepID=UPI0005B6A3ED|nr:MULTISPECIES: 2,3-diaminopropionate biosynthesis protein SbnB [unclassified Bacillus (in: firmicutes)]KIQ78191.1 ornithine cyclodeaminase [Bacillus sp. L_1B0_8]KIQ82555.1 ornithine cyclodeaminase [Bacillus sp. L_1B0_5]
MLNNCIEPQMLYLNRDDILKLGNNSSKIYVDAIRKALVLHSEKNFSQPLKPYLKTYQKDEHIADRIIAMPAYLGEPAVSGIKWIGSKYNNPIKRNMERASALIILNNPETNFPVAILEGSVISSMRTAAVTVVASQHLAKKNFGELSIIGCGLIAKKHLQSMLENFNNIKNVYLYDLSVDKANELADVFKQNYTNVHFEVCTNLKNVVEEAEVLVTCTVTDKPYIQAEWLKKGVFVSNISIMDLEKDTFLKADKVVVDDWDQANREKKIINQLVEEGKFSRDMLYAELGEVVSGKKVGRESEDEIIILNPMGMAIEDISCAYELYEKARNQNIGTKLSLY